MHLKRDEQGTPGRAVMIRAGVDGDRIIGIDEERRAARASGESGAVEQISRHPGG
jgi:hypothetical protein